MKKRIKEYKNILIELEKDGKVIYDISCRGGRYGLKSSEAIEIMKITGCEEYLPKIVGCFSNYLGGGIRGAIVGGGYDERISAKDSKKIDDFTSACIERYLEIENGCGLNNEEHQDGEINWDFVATKKSRIAGVVSAY